jgi:CheY-like chemotaxis protein
MSFRGTRQPGLLFLNVMMPKKDGYSFLKELRRNELHATTPTVMISSKDYAQDRTAAKELGVLEFVAKPISKKAIRADREIFAATADEHSRLGRAYAARMNLRRRCTSAGSAQILRPMAARHHLAGEELMAQREPPLTHSDCFFIKYQRGCRVVKLSNQMSVFRFEMSLTAGHDPDRRFHHAPSVSAIKRHHATCCRSRRIGVISDNEV